MVDSFIYFSFIVLKKKYLMENKQQKHLVKNKKQLSL